MGFHGFSLVEIMVGVFILGVLGVGLSRMLINTGKTQKNFELKNDKELMRMMIANGVDCAGTFQSASINPDSPGVSCNSTSDSGGQVPPYLRLRRATKNPACTGTTPPTECYLTGPLGTDGSAKLGSWNVRASCSGAEQTMVIRLARLDAGGNALKNPLTGSTDSWTADSGLLFGRPTAPGGMTLCFGAGASAGGWTVSEVGQLGSAYSPTIAAGFKYVEMEGRAGFGPTMYSANFLYNASTDSVTATTFGAAFGTFQHAVTLSKGATVTLCANGVASCGGVRYLTNGSLQLTAPAATGNDYGTYTVYK